MANSIEVLAYIKKSFRTPGRMQRQKILYYAQAWHLVWQGAPLFEEDIEAWQNGPVVPIAWRADKGRNDEPGRDYPGDLTPEQCRIVDTVWEFYGRNGGAALSTLTHTEDPWIRHYTEVNPLPAWK